MWNRGVWGVLSVVLKWDAELECFTAYIQLSYSVIGIDLPAKLRESSQKGFLIRQVKGELSPQPTREKATIGLRGQRFYQRVVELLSGGTG